MAPVRQIVIQKLDTFPDLERSVLQTAYQKPSLAALTVMCDLYVLLFSANLPLMDYLWTPWRYAYVTSDSAKSKASATGCIFCDLVSSGDDESARIVHRARKCFIILNAFPYTPGHCMIVPYEHLDELQKLPDDAAQEMMALSQRMESVMRELYKPDGVNLGMNIGKAAGAGVAGHIHMHILPRWLADANFMSVVGETRVLPETLDVTYKRIKAALTASSQPEPGSPA